MTPRVASLFTAEVDVGPLPSSCLRRVHRRGWPHRGHRTRTKGTRRPSGRFATLKTIARLRDRATFNTIDLAATINGEQVDSPDVSCEIGPSTMLDGQTLALRAPRS